MFPFKEEHITFAKSGCCPSLLPLPKEIKIRLFKQRRKPGRKKANKCFGAPGADPLLAADRSAFRARGRRLDAMPKATSLVAELTVANMAGGGGAGWGSWMVGVSWWLGGS